MSPIIKRHYFYAGPSSDIDKNFILKLANGSIEESSRDLYFDKKLTKKAGTLFLHIKKINNNGNIPVVEVEATASTPEGSFIYRYHRDDYRKKILKTGETSGVFRTGTVTKTYLAEEKILRTRMLAYRSDE
jgi:hypothetical protein